MKRLFLSLVLSFLVILFAQSSFADYRWLDEHKGAVTRVMSGGAGLFYDSKISAINRNQGALYFSGTKWEADTTFPYIHPRCMFIDSQGTIYIAGKNNADNDSYIYESTNGLNYTAVQQVTSDASISAMWNFTEDDHGNIWAGEYLASAGTDAHLWRRVQSTGAWAKVMTWDGTGGTIDERHIHWTYYCPYRDALYIGIGDNDNGIIKLIGSKLNQASFVAADFEYIVPTDDSGFGVCVTTMTSDEDYLYVGIDMHTEHANVSRSIARITDDGSSQTIEHVYPLTKGLIWTWCYNQDGVIVFNGFGSNVDFGGGYPVVNIIVASGDQGVTWSVARDLGTGAQKGMEFTGLPSYYYDSWDGMYAGGRNGAKGSIFAAGKVIETNATFFVDQTNGIDWTNAGTDINKPVKTFRCIEAKDIHAGDTVQLIGTNTYSLPLIVGCSGENDNTIKVRGNITSVLSGGSAGTTGLFVEDFEGAKNTWGFSLNEAGGSISEEAVIVKEGLQSVKVIRGATGTTDLTKNIINYAIGENDTLYVRYWIYFPDDTPASEKHKVMRFIDSSNFEQCLERWGTTSVTETNELIIQATLFGAYNTSREPLSTGEWHKIEFEMLCHPTSGSILLKVDNKIRIMFSGIKTQTAGEVLNYIRFYFYQNPITVYIDDFELGAAPFDDYASFNSNSFDYLDVYGVNFQGISGALIDEDSSNINICGSVFEGLTESAIQVDGSNNGVYHNTIYDTAGHAIIVNSDVTVQNNIIQDSVGDSVNIAVGKTVTGGYNCFSDIASGGAGTYTDVGSSTLWETDPMLKNISVDYALKRNSPCRDTGLSSPATHDYRGWRIPSNSSPDMGAYEYYRKTYGGMHQSVAKKTSGTILKVEESGLVNLDSTIGVMTIYLPPLELSRGVPFFLHKDNAGNNITVIANESGVTIGGAADKTLTNQYDTLLVWGGTDQWYCE